MRDAAGPRRPLVIDSDRATRVTLLGSYAALLLPVTQLRLEKLRTRPWLGYPLPGWFLGACTQPMLSDDSAAGPETQQRWRPSVGVAGTQHIPHPRKRTAVQCPIYIMYDRIC